MMSKKRNNQDEISAPAKKQRGSSESEKYMIFTEEEKRERINKWETFYKSIMKKSMSPGQLTFIDDDSSDNKNERPETDENEMFEKIENTQNTPSKTLVPNQRTKANLKTCHKIKTSESDSQKQKKDVDTKKTDKKSPSNFLVDQQTRAKSNILKKLTPESLKNQNDGANVKTMNKNIENEEKSESGEKLPAKSHKHQNKVADVETSKKHIENAEKTVKTRVQSKAFQKTKLSKSDFENQDLNFEKLTSKSRTDQNEVANVETSNKNIENKEKPVKTRGRPKAPEKTKPPNSDFENQALNGGKLPPESLKDQKEVANVETLNKNIENKEKLVKTRGKSKDPQKPKPSKSNFENQVQNGENKNAKITKTSTVLATRAKAKSKNKGNNTDSKSPSKQVENGKNSVGDFHEKTEKSPQKTREKEKKVIQLPREKVLQNVKLSNTDFGNYKKSRDVIETEVPEEIQNPSPRKTQANTKRSEKIATKSAPKNQNNITAMQTTKLVASKENYVETEIHEKMEGTSHQNSKTVEKISTPKSAFKTKNKHVCATPKKVVFCAINFASTSTPKKDSSCQTDSELESLTLQYSRESFDDTDTACPTKKDLCCQTDDTSFEENPGELGLEYLAKSFCKYSIPEDSSSELSEDLKIGLLDDLVRLVIKRNESKVLQDSFFLGWNNLFIYVCRKTPIDKDEMKAYIRRSMSMDNIEDIRSKIEKDLGSNLGTLLSTRNKLKTTELNKAIAQEWGRLCGEMPLKDVVLYSRVTKSPKPAKASVI